MTASSFCVCCPRSVIISSVRPSLKNSWDASELRLSNGNTSNTILRGVDGRTSTRREWTTKTEATIKQASTPKARLCRHENRDVAGGKVLADGDRAEASACKCGSPKDCVVASYELSTRVTGAIKR